MSSDHNPIRRAVMLTLASLPLNAASRNPSDGGDTRREGSQVLVAYFTRSGNTRVVAGLIHRELRADLFEIRPATPYPEDYLETVEQARKERDSDFEPILKGKVSNMADYDTVFLGFPIWGGTTPPVVRAFLSTHDVSGKTLVPFVTHGGYGLDDCMAVLASHARKARIQAGFSMEADQERRTMESVARWLRRADVSG
jgi:flavodoxin